MLINSFIQSEQSIFSTLHSVARCNCMLFKWAFGIFSDLDSELFRNCDCFLEQTSFYGEIERFANGITPAKSEVPFRLDIR